jgi:hypothetical protein
MSKCNSEAAKTSNEAGRLAIRRDARRYTPKVKKRGRKRKQLHKCFEKFTRTNFLSLEVARDKSMHVVAPFPAA